jgi:hypothetical protein
MKKQILVAAAALVWTTLAPTQSHAQQAAQANIPFEFQVGNKTMPAGEYKVLRVSSNDAAVQLIQRTDSSVSTFALTNAIDGIGKSTQPKLVFHCYDSECFLSEIWTGSVSGRLLLPSRREREVSRAKSENEMAVLVLPLTAKL